ncbi:hypothetical protein OE88DRAFT_1601561, partial [Heliocybe sulcata]
NVGVFWDFENRALPLKNVRKTQEFASKTREAVEGYGHVATFKAYLDFHYLDSPALHSALDSAGISAINCPHNGRAEVVDDAIRDDMQHFARGCSSPATILLISGDRDYARTVRDLSERGHRTVVIAP